MKTTKPPVIQNSGDQVKNHVSIDNPNLPGNL